MLALVELLGVVVSLVVVVLLLLLLLLSLGAGGTAAIARCVTVAVGILRPPSPRTPNDRTATRRKPHFARPVHAPLRGLPDDQRSTGESFLFYFSLLEPGFGVG